MITFVEYLTENGYDKSNIRKRNRHICNALKIYTSSDILRFNVPSILAALVRNNLIKSSESMFISYQSSIDLYKKYLCAQIDAELPLHRQWNASNHHKSVFCSDCLYSRKCDADSGLIRCENPRCDNYRERKQPETKRVCMGYVPKIQVNE